MPQHLSVCCLCGLMCPLSSERLSRCERRRRWLTQPQPNPSHASVDDYEQQIQSISQLFAPGRRPLIWIDAAEVNTMRAAVELTRVARSTLHIGASTSAHNVRRVLTSQGWMGTSLAEVATHADLIITLGNGILSEAPLLSERFIAPAIADRQARWYHIGESELPVAGASWQTHWPRQQWYEKLTELLWAIHDPQKLATIATPVKQLAQQLLDARYAVWLWEADEFCNAIDELCVRRLLGLARAMSVQHRCSLLRLESEVGRITAEETLLWLTGLTPTASYDGQRWHDHLETASFTLERWQQEFDAILFVRTVPSVRPLPSLDASHYLMPAHAASAHQLKQNTTRVATAGIDYAAHLWRGDRAITLHCAPEQERNAATSQPTAQAVLERVRHAVEQRSRRNDH